jgi:hypothetical protein
VTSCIDCGGRRSPSSGARCLQCHDAYRKRAVGGFAPVADGFAPVVDGYASEILRQEMRRLAEGERALRVLGARWRTTFPIGAPECEREADGFATKQHELAVAIRAVTGRPA